MTSLLNNLSLDLFAFGAVISSLFVITSKNPVISVLFLISVFVNSAIYLILLGVSFVGISYVIVYVGAIAVIFLFILMMINIRLTDILELGTDYTKNLPLALIIAAIFIFSIFGVITNLNIFNSSLGFTIINSINSFTAIQSSLVSDSTSVSLLSNNLPVLTNSFTGYVDSKLINYTQLDSLGFNLYTQNAVLLIITSLVLLLSMFTPIIFSTSYTSKFKS